MIQLEYYMSTEYYMPIEYDILTEYQWRINVVICRCKFVVFEFKIRSGDINSNDYFGGHCNNLMYSPKPSNIVAELQRQLGHLPYHLLEDLIRILPQPSTNSNTARNIHQRLLNAITAEYDSKSRIYANAQVDQINAEIVSKAGSINQQLGARMKTVLFGFQFIELAKSIIQKGKLSQLGTSAKAQLLSRFSQKRNELTKAKSQFNFDVIKSNSNNQKNEPMNIYKLGENKINQQCKNLTTKPQCLCPNQREINVKDDNSFKCVHCHRLFHTICMKKKANAEYCCYCHLEKMIPVKRVIKPVYLGLFRRNIRKHMTSFFVPELEANQKFQVRCLRLKEGAPTSCLFPDMADIMMNGHHIRQFEPINKQSCLKYRKDEPFTLLKGDYYPNQQNTLTLNETVLSLKEKQVRYESENHLFGVYVIQDIKIDTLINQMKKQSVLGFSESAGILNDCFDKFGNGDEDLTCQLVKIPLYCPLSTVRIEIPARGIFCKHFQCFDLKNYLTLISESLNPRWICPLCKVVSYQLQIDSILQQILNKIRANDKVQQILFFRNGDYTSIIDDEPDFNRSNIRSLNIPERKKRQIPQKIEQKPVAKKNFHIPDNADVIELD